MCFKYECGLFENLCLAVPILSLHIHSRRLTQKSPVSSGLLVTPRCRCFVCVRCDVCCTPACWLLVWSRSPISVCLRSICRCVSFVSPRLMFGPGAGFRCAVTAIPRHCFWCLSSLFSVASRGSRRCEGSLADVSGFTRALSFGLSLRRCTPCYRAPRSRWRPVPPTASQDAARDASSAPF